MAMNERLPQRLTRRTFLQTSGKLALGAAGLLAGSSGLFVYGALHDETRAAELPGNFVRLGSVEELSVREGFVRVSYTANYKDAWVDKSESGTVYVTIEENGSLLILSSVCTHLGCTIEPVPEAEWNEDGEALYFRCPCHLAEFSRRGNSIRKFGIPGLDTYKPYIAGGDVYINILAPIRGESNR
ncbi:ubiquinol-cytochrome c reductase iron-sulfur subunit [Paenibacillus sp. HJGM_3]|uniref:QcrA and Rieske domain-containing protein n=1 Tax=Paenibacillus sp. HJGM_3 TaxID=3379816 RepID=UPI00385E0B86